MQTIEGSSMPGSQRSRLGKRAVAAILAGAVGVVCALLVSLAVAKSFTLQVAANAPVTNTSHTTKHEPIAVTSKGFAVYTLTGDTTHHLLCTGQNMCFQFWPPAKVSSKKVAKASGIKGKLGTFKRGGFTQLTLNGQPLYMFSGDSQKRAATGEGIVGFGGTWHVVKATASKKANQTTSTPTTTSTSTGTTTGPYGY
jgi:predicted lipoprotein with Yx(FWY)xxD motif